VKTLRSILLAGLPLIAAAQNGAHLDFSGMWLVQDPGSGGFTEWFDNVPKPRLRAEIVRDNKALAASAAARNVVNAAERRADCPVGNLPLMMASSPLNIVQSRDEIMIGAEANRGAPFIQMDAAIRRARICCRPDSETRSDTGKERPWSWIRSAFPRVFVTAATPCW
jgi:hypothetical protein